MFTQKRENEKCCITITNTIKLLKNQTLHNMLCKSLTQSKIFSKISAFLSPSYFPDFIPYLSFACSPLSDSLMLLRLRGHTPELGSLVHNTHAQYFYSITNDYFLSKVYLDLPSKNCHHCLKCIFTSFTQFISLMIAYISWKYATWLTFVLDLLFYVWSNYNVKC